jgi:hypothetical protein
MADWRYLSLQPFILCPLDVVREHVTRIALGRLTN